MKILITGAKGELGYYLTETIAGAVGLSHQQLDITDKQMVKTAVEFHQPDLIINCAVLDHEESIKDPVRAYEVNVEGLRNLLGSGPKVLHISSSVVYDPRDTYGLTKIVAENIVDLKKHLILRLPPFRYNKKKFVSDILIEKIPAIIEQIAGHTGLFCTWDLKRGWVKTKLINLLKRIWFRLERPSLKRE